ncbi:DNA (cytosine-5-)-methyltransferase [Oceanobacillus caeni]|uniref:DNA (cytosine-5-)-methyltransferase n=1 Tax=Oceanobacillus caeni TaxID=405946 RepID=UPI00214A1FF4|nr:DNA (cytosine-5-)-methyltransferase [Oceanobacillus caeni]MCR1833080.1 DNA (cytosine-5-)-methyltransferase [Oceanobacillus caeni]
MNVLSLFDGMSCGQIALERVGVKVNKYYASEINEKSIEITMKNYPNTIQLGDITQLDVSGLEVNLLIGGSPCQNLSRTVINNIKHNQGLKGEKSSLFYDYVRILTETKPKYFLFENVESMRNEDKDIITETLGVEPIMINSCLVSAQDRKRYYWTNIPNVTQPEDKELLLKDIVVPAKEVPDKYWYKQEFTYHGDDKRPIATLHIKGHDILKRVYGLNQKAPTLTACRGGNLQKKALQNGKPRKLTPTEYERLQTVPEGYTEGVADTHRYNMLGDGWTVDVIAHILSGLK